MANLEQRSKMKITLHSKFLLVGSKEEIESAHNVLCHQNLTNSWEKYHICIQ